MHYGKNWIVRDNVFIGIRSPGGGLAEHAIHFWSDSAGTLIERNRIINCGGGIGFGLGDRGHSGGIIRNNFIFHDGSAGDVGIGLESARNAQVYHNTIFYENDYSNAIEYRFAQTSAMIVNNLTNRAVQQREGVTAAIVHQYSSSEI